jgi:hypothetical protein
MILYKKLTTALEISFVENEKFQSAGLRGPLYS